MNAMAHRAMPWLWGVVLLALVAAGCRTYGGYGSTEEIVVQIEQSNRLFAEELDRARRDLSALQRAAATDPALAGFAAQYETVVQHHAASLEEHRALAAEATAAAGTWVGIGTYHTVHRNYGAILTGEQIIRDRYAEVLAGVQHALDTTATPGAMREEGQWQALPAFYERLQTRKRSMSDLLAGAAAPAAVPADTAAAN